MLICTVLGFPPNFIGLLQTRLLNFWSIGSDSDPPKMDVFHNKYMYSIQSEVAECPSHRKFLVTYQGRSLRSSRDILFEWIPLRSLLELNREIGVDFGIRLILAATRESDYRTILAFYKRCFALPQSLGLWLLRGELIFVILAAR